MNFKNKVVIITGSSSGIGAATAELFAHLSAKVVIVGRNEERLHIVAKKVKDAKGIQPLIIKADVTKDVEVQSIVSETINKFGQIDVLVNNAGSGVNGCLEDGIGSFDTMMATNLRSVYLLTSLVRPHIIKTKGNIVNVSSVASIKPLPNFLAYCISKAGIDMFTKGVAKELAPLGVRVNSVNPGIVSGTNLPSSVPGWSRHQVLQLMDRAVKNSPLGYISTCENVANLIVFLASDKAISITGSIYLIDNGMMIA